MKNKKISKLAIISLICVPLMFILTPILLIDFRFSLIIFPLPILAFVLGIIALIRINKDKNLEGKIFAILGIILGLIFIIIIVIPALLAYFGIIDPSKFLPK